MFEELNGKRLLIFGGTGSIGKAILQQLSSHIVLPAVVTIASRDENKHYHLRKEADKYGLKIETVICDIRSSEGLAALVARHDVVFAAAAMKHVPLVEEFPAQGIKTNVLGAMNVIEAVRVAGNPINVVAFSTDKACYPECVMGMTKALQERLFLSASGELELQNCRINVVRYGNLLASRGSAIPVFVNQLRAGSKVTITDKEMTRFFSFMTDAADLCLTAACSEYTGQLFVPRLRSAKIIDLVKALADCLEIREYLTEEIGVRGSEKLHEHMLNDYEGQRVLGVWSKHMQVSPFSKEPTSSQASAYVSNSELCLMSPTECRDMMFRFLVEFDRMVSGD